MADGNHSLHDLLLVDGDDSLALEVSRVLCIAIDQGHGAISIATREHQRIIDRQLEVRGIDVAAARAQGQYLAFDATGMLARISVAGSPNAIRFAGVVAEIVESLRSRFTRVSVFGEMVALLWASGKHQSAIHLEKLWNELVKNYPILLYCAYPKTAITEHAHAEAFRQVCAEHCVDLQADGSTLPLAVTRP